MFIQSKQRFIPTVSGKITIDLLKSQSMNNYSPLFPNITTLPYEHLIQNLCDYIHIDNNIMDQKEEISLSNLNKIIKHPFASYQNLYLESNIDKCSNELSELSKFNTMLVCDITYDKNNFNLETLKQISNVSKINICHGLYLDYNYTDIKKYSNDIQYQIVYGDYSPSFIGEISPKDTFPIDSREDTLFTMVINDLINKYEIPLFIKLNQNHKKNEGKNILNWFDSKNIKFKNKIVFIVSLSDNENYDLNTILIESILSKGYSLILTTFDCDTSKEKYFEEEMDNYFCKSKAEYINRILLKLKEKYIDRIMLSNGINFRIQLKGYGGFGYGNIFINYYNDLIKGLNKEEISKIFGLNLLNLLEWWREVEVLSKTKKTVICANCGIEKDEDDKNLFRKFDKAFCSFDCLKSYLKKNK